MRLKSIVALALLLCGTISAAAQSTRTFGNYVGSLPAATSPLATSDKLYVLQGGISKAINNYNLVTSNVPAGAFNYYVNNSTGNDANNGLTTGTAFLTIQHAANVASQWSQDTSTCTRSGGLSSCSSYITINIDGSGATYTENIFLPPATKPVPESANLNIVGFNGTPVIDGCIYTNARNWTLTGPLKFVDTTTNCPTIEAENGFLSINGSVEFGANTQSQPHIYAVANAEVDLNSLNYTISGGASAHMFARGNSFMRTSNVTFVGTPSSINFSTSFMEVSASTIDATGNTYTNSAAVSGIRFRLINGGNLMTTKPDPNFFPGSFAGVVNADSGYGNMAGGDVPTTFALLPSGTFVATGMSRVINDGLAANCGDASCTTWATTVSAGSGSLALSLWYNGSNWTLKVNSHAVVERIRG